MTFSNNKELVSQVLSINIASRDDDILLLRLCVKEIYKGNLYSLSFAEYCDGVLSNTYPHFESVRRIRQKIK